MSVRTSRIIKLIAFILIASLVTAHVYSVIRWKESTGILKFYEYDRDQADVIFYGASRTACAIDPSVMWDRYGIAAIDLAEGGQNLGSTYYYMEESLRTQHPQIMMVDLAIMETVDDGHDGNMYINTINMKYSPIYVKNAYYEWSHSVFSDSKNMLKWILLKFPVFHSRYKEINYTDYQPITNEMPAHYASYSVGGYDVPEGCDVTDTHELSDEIKQYLDSMIELAQSNGAEIVFYVPPYSVPREHMEGFNAAEQYVSERGCKFINYNAIYREIGFDYATDMVDEGAAGSHVNADGCVKVTDHMTEYLHDNYDLPDRRGDEHYAVYDAISHNTFLNENAHDIREASDSVIEVLKLANEEDYYVAVVLSGEGGERLAQIIDSTDGVMDGSKVSDWVYCNGVSEAGGSRYKLGKFVTLTVDPNMIFIVHSSQTTNGQDAELIVVEKRNGEIVMNAGYNVDENGDTSVAWWGI